MFVEVPCSCAVSEVTKVIVLKLKYRHDHDPLALAARGLGSSRHRARTFRSDDLAADRPDHPSPASQPAPGLVRSDDPPATDQRCYSSHRIHPRTTEFLPGTMPATVHLCRPVRHRPAGSGQLSLR